MGEPFDLAGSLEARHRQHHLGLVKTVEDVVRYERVIREVRPSLVVEVGAFSCKAALWFAQHAAVLTCDPEPQIDPPVAEVLHRQSHPVRVHVGRSDSPGFADAVADEMRAHPGPVLLSLDGDHSEATVYGELEAFAHLAAYIVVEDTLLRWFPIPERVYEGDPFDAIDRWLPEHPEWTRDVEVETMFAMTQFPGGWLRRTEP